MKGAGLLVTARSKYALSLYSWQSAVTDSRAVLRDGDVAEAFCSKVAGLFNLCSFEEVSCIIPLSSLNACPQALVTAKRGEAKFKNDARFREWSFKCMQVIIEATHKNVFLGFDDESVRNLDRKMSPHERKKSQVDM